MNIFDPHISGSLSVSGSGEISGDLRVLGTISGSIKGDGSQLFNIPSSGVTGLNLTRIADGVATASISSANGLRINSNTEITGALKLNKVNLGSNNIVDMTLTDGGGKYFINGVKNPRLSFIRGFKYRFYYNNNNTHPLLFSLTSDGEHNAGTIYTTGVTTNANPFYVEVEVTDATAATFYYWCDHHVGMGNAITVYSDFLQGQSTIGLINVDTTALATTGSNNFTNIQRTSGSLVVTGSVDITGSITLNGQAIGTGKLDETTFQSYTSSNDSTNSTQNSRLTSIESATSSLNSFTSSIDNTIKNKLNTEAVITGSVQVIITGTTGYSTFSSSISTSIGSLSSSVATTTSGLSSSIDSLSSSVATTTSGLSSSIATTTSGLSSSIGSLSSSFSSTNDTQNGKLTSIETSTSSLNTFTSSIDTTIKNKLNTETVISGSVQVLITSTTGYSSFSSSISTSVGLLSSSVATTTSGLSSSIGSLSSSFSSTNDAQNSKITSIETSTSSLNSYTSSNITNINAIHTSTSSLNTFSSSILGSIELTGSNLTVKGDLVVKGTTTQIDSTTVNIGDNIIQLNGTGATNAGIVVRDATAPNTISGSLLWDTTNDYWKAGIVGSEEKIILNTEYSTFSTSIDSRATSLQTSTSSLNTYTSSNNTNISAIHTSTGSLNTFTSSANTKFGVIETSTSSLNTFTSSLLTAIELTGSNLTVRGNFLVKGTTTNVNTTTLDVDNNLINLNGNGASFAGIRVKDTTGPNLISGSLLWDSANDYWIAGQLGSEQRLVRETEFNNAVTRVGNVETSTGSLNSFTSSINTTIKTKLNTEGVLSGSIQVNHNTTTNYVANEHINHTAVSITAGSGLTGGGDISTTRTINVGAGNGITVNADDIAIDTSSATFTTGVKTKLNTEGVISGSAQVTLSSTTGYGSVLNQAVLSTSSPTFAGATFSGNVTINTNISGLILNRTAVTNYNGISLQTAAVSQWFVGMRENLSSNNYIIYNESGTDALTISKANSNATFAGTISASNYSGTHTGASSGTNTGDETLARVNALAITTVGTITSGIWNGTAIANANLANSSFNIGTTSISLGRASASQTLTGVSIDGNATSETLSTVTSRGATTTAAITISKEALAYGGTTQSFLIDGAAGNAALTLNAASAYAYLNFAQAGVTKWEIGAEGAATNKGSLYFNHNVQVGSTGAALYIKKSNGFVGILNIAPTTALDVTGAGTFSGTISASNFSGTHSGASSNTNTGDETLARVNALAITTVGTIGTGVWNGSSISTTYTAAKVTAVNAGTGVGVDTTTGSVTVSIGQSVATSAVPTFKAAILTSDTDSRVLKLRELASTSGNIIQFQDSAGNNKWEVVGRSNTDATPFYIYKNDGTNTGYIFSISGSGIPNFHTALTIGGSTAKSISNSSYSTSFSSVSSVTVTHSLGTKDVAVFVYDSSDNMFWPSSIVTTSTSVVTITFASSRSGRVVVVR